MQKNQSLNKTIAEYRKNFYKVYNNLIIPIFREFEIERKKRLKKLFIWMPICALLVFIEVLCLLKIMSIFLIFLILVTITIAGFILFFISSSFADDLKNACMPKLLQLFGNISWSNGIDSVSNSDLNKSSLFSSFNERSSEDCFSGLYNGVNYTVNETVLFYKSSSGKNRKCKTIFKGVVINFSSNKLIKSKTIIKTRWENSIKRSLPLLFFAISAIAATLAAACAKWNFSEVFLFLLLFCGAHLSIMYWSDFCRKREKNLQEIKLEDPEFNKKYRAYSSDQVEGRYLITPAFMERFKNIQTAFGTDKVKCSFFDNNLMFAISTRKNLFEIGNLFYGLENPKQLETFFDELTSIFMLIDYFKLNEKTGL